MINLQEIVNLQTDLVQRWHQQSVDNQQQGFLSTVCQQTQYNYLLWHEEDIARSPDVGDPEIARVKRSIDRYNQQRNDWIEKIDDEIGALLQSGSVVCAEDAPLNTETPGSAIDRLSIMALRLFHLHEQLERTDIDDDHRQSVEHKIAVCQLQQNDLMNSAQQLVEAIFSGEKRHRTYRQFKMYNDPTLNPYLYRRAKVDSGATSEKRENGGASTAAKCPSATPAGRVEKV